jgi:hypothetical protein
MFKGNTLMNDKKSWKNIYKIQKKEYKFITLNSVHIYDLNFIQ